MVWNILYFTAAVAAASGNGVVAGVFIPIADLPGITAAAELGNANKERKAAFAVANKVFEVLDGNSAKLGLAVTRPAVTGAPNNRINQAFTYTVQYAVNHANNTVGMLPLPGSNTGLVSLVNVFAGSSIVAADDAIPGAGILVPNTVITASGGAIPGTTAADARSWLSGMYQSLITGLDANEAVIQAARGTATGVAPAANFTGTGAITGLTVNDLASRSFFSVTYNLTMQLLLNQAAQTFDLAA